MKNPNSWKGIRNVCGCDIMGNFAVKYTVFVKSAAKLLYQTAKSCQYLKKNAIFLRKCAFFVFIRGETQ